MSKVDKSRRTLARASRTGDVVSTEIIGAGQVDFGRVGTDIPTGVYGDVLIAIRRIVLTSTGPLQLILYRHDVTAGDREIYRVESSGGAVDLDDLVGVDTRPAAGEVTGASVHYAIANAGAARLAIGLEHETR